MPRPILFRRRQVWLPTLWGWILLLAATALLLVVAARHLYAFLAENHPVGAPVLVVEGWLAADELDQAAAAFKAGGYQRLITTGGPLSGTVELAAYGDYATLAADYLARHGVPRALIDAVPAPRSPRERTFLSAVAVREAAPRLGIRLDAIDIFSAGAHARRSRLLYEMAFGPGVRVGVMAARPDSYQPEAWWRSSAGAESIVFQTIGLAWVKCCFQPGTD